MITSANYPFDYPNNENTTKTITVSEGSTIKIHIEDIDIEHHPTCSYDYLYVEDSNGSVLMGRTCGSDIPPDFESFTNEVSVIFHSDGSERRKGWKLIWTVRVYVPLSGEIKSDNFPAPYPDNTYKTYIIEVTQGKKIKISFDHFDLEHHAPCEYDYILIMVIQR